MSTNDKPDTAASRAQRVVDENVRVANAEMPGQRANLPAGTLTDGPTENQADENRDQPVGPEGKLTTPAKPPLT